MRNTDRSLQCTEFMGTPNCMQKTHLKDYTVAKFEVLRVINSYIGVMEVDAPVTPSTSRDESVS